MTEKEKEGGEESKSVKDASLSLLLPWAIP